MPPDPVPAAEWASQVLAAITMSSQATTWGDLETEFAAKAAPIEQVHNLIVQALDAHARQQVEAFRERTAQTVIGTTWELEAEERHGIAAAIRALEP